jgi:hypothetical protein
MGEESLGRAVAVAALAPVAERLADEQERKQREEDQQRQLEEALLTIPELSRPMRPEEPASAEFSSDIFVAMVFWGEVVSLAFVGPFLLGPLVFGKKFSESGYPWLLLLIAPGVIAALAGFWPIIKANPVRGRYRTEMEAYEKATREADRRRLQRAEVQRKYEGGSK